MSEADSVLIQRFADAHDREAFCEITRRHAGLVYSACLRVLGDRGRAEDASQETFLQLLRQPGRAKGSVAGWLYTVATRAAIDLARKDTALKKRENAYAHTRPDGPSRWAEISPHIDEALTELDEEHRWVILEHFLEGRVQSELARVSAPRSSA